jgi:hypothetical protein
MSKLKELEFHEAMLSIYKQAKAECNYNATRFLQMINEQGGLQTAKTLLHALGYSEGFTAIWQCGRLDLSMEALVLKDEWRDLFSEEELGIARKRLEDYGYTFGK